MSADQLPAVPPAVTVLDSWTWTPPTTVHPDCTPMDVLELEAARAPAPPPPPSWTRALIASPEDGGPTPEEIAAARALTVDQRRALTKPGGPGWSVHDDGRVIPRLHAPPAVVINNGVDAWIPASEWGILAHAPPAPGFSRGLTLTDGEWDAWSGPKRIAEGSTPRLAALRLLATVPR